MEIAAAVEMREFGIVMALKVAETLGTEALEVTEVFDDVGCRGELEKLNEAEIANELVFEKKICLCSRSKIALRCR
jgi:hypothetical protein